MKYDLVVKDESKRSSTKAKGKASSKTKTGGKGDSTSSSKSRNKSSHLEINMSATGNVREKAPTELHCSCSGLFAQSC